MPSAEPDTPLSFLIKGITDLANRGRRLSQQQAAATTGYQNPKPLITVEPHVLVDQKNEKSLLQGGDIVFANGARIPLPSNINLPTTGLWHQLLDIPQVPSWPPLSGTICLSVQSLLWLRPLQNYCRLGPLLNKRSLEILEAGDIP